MATNTPEADKRCPPQADHQRPIRDRHRPTQRRQRWVRKRDCGGL